MTLLSGRSLSVVVLDLTSSVLLRVHQRGHDNCPVPSWRCSLDTRCSSSARLAFRRGCDCSRLSPGVDCPVQVGAALWTLAIRHRPGLHVVSVVTAPDCRPVSAAAVWTLALRHQPGFRRQCCDSSNLRLRVCCPVPLWRCSLDARYCSLAWSSSSVLLQVHQRDHRVYCSVPSWRCSLAANYPSTVCS